MKNTVVILHIIVFSFVRTIFAEDSAKYLTAHVIWQPVICIPFIVEANELQNNYFINPMVGVKILSISADGKFIPPVDAHTDYDGLNQGVTNFNGRFVYNLCSSYETDTNHWILTSIIDLDKKNTLIRDFFIPRNAREISIRYKIRYCDLQLSKEMMIISRHF